MLLLMVHPSFHILKLFLKFTPLVTVRGRDYSYKEINFEFFNPLETKNFVLDILSLFNFYLKALLVSLLLYFNSSKFVGDEYLSDAFYILKSIKTRLEPSTFCVLRCIQGSVSYCIKTLALS